MKTAMIRFTIAMGGAMLASPAFAHLDPVAHGSFLAGFTHPLFGLDHILAMVAVGLWAASIGAMPARGEAVPSSGHALWAIPLAFVATMGIGFIAAIAGIPLPFVEPVILASVIFIGIMVALALPLPAIGVAAVVAFFALFHGHAHGEEMGAAGALGYAAGFLAATALLHAAGIALGLGVRRFLASAPGRWAMRGGGVLTAFGGLWLALAG